MYHVYIQHKETFSQHCLGGRGLKGCCVHPQLSEIEKSIGCTHITTGCTHITTGCTYITYLVTIIHCLSLTIFGIITVWYPTVKEKCISEAYNENIPKQ